MRPVLWSVLPLLLAACSGLSFEPAGPDAAPDPAKPGPFAVGVRTVTITDPSRLRPDGSARRLVTEIWYPAEESARGKPGESYGVEPLLTDAQRATLGATKLPTIDTSAVRDASPRLDHGPYPLIVFSHGQAETRWSLAFATVALASHGFVVVAPDHEGHTLGDQARDEMDDQGQTFGDRPLDAMLVIDTFTALEKTDPLAGMVNPAHVGMMGHSFGALTTLRTAALDDRIRAIAPMAPPSAQTAWLGLGTTEHPVSLAIPVLLEAGHADTVTPWDTATVPTWNALKKPRFQLDLTTGGHFTFSALCPFVDVDLPFTIGGRSVREGLGNGCLGDAPKPAVAQPLITHFTVAFFNATLRGSPGSFAFLTQARADAVAGPIAVVTSDR